MPDPATAAGPVPYQIRRSRRARRVRIVVAPGGIEVVAPHGVPASEIAVLLAAHEAWIRRKTAALRQALAAHPGPARLAGGGTILVRGAPRDLVVDVGDHPRARLEAGDPVRVLLPARLALEARERLVGDLLERWLRRAALEDAQAQASRHGARHGLVPSAIRIKAQRRLWGSCTAAGVINLNWRLILAPPEVLEYVVVHELCHLRERHHQPPFWRLVAEVLPDYGRWRRWLKENGHLLCLRPGEFG
jgi:predicted metal-dependent hydrolase